MQEFDFVIKYQKGCQNGNADALSRHIPSNPSVAATVFLKRKFRKHNRQTQYCRKYMKQYNGIFAGQHHISGTSPHYLDMANCGLS